jgi:sulfopyruvate decarboxylase TPP-binding subunit
MGRAVIPILDQLGLPHYTLEDDGNMEQSLNGAMKLCYANRQPLGICLTTALHGGKVA